MSRRDFYEMRPGEFWEALRAYNDEKEADRRHVGELARGATLRLWNLQVAKSSRIKVASKFWQMPWDDVRAENDEIKRLAGLSEEEAQIEAQKFLNRLNHGRGTESEGNNRR